MECSLLWNFVAQVKDAYDVHRRRIMEKFNLSAIEVDVLVFLVNNPQLNTASQIVKLRKMSKSHVSKAVRGLLGKRYLKSVSDPNDRKKILLYPADGAREAIAFSMKEQAAFAHNIAGSISPEEEDAFQTVIQTVCSNIAEVYGSDLVTPGEV